VTVPRYLAAKALGHLRAPGAVVVDLRLAGHPVLRFFVRCGTSTWWRVERTDINNPIQQHFPRIVTEHHYWTVGPHDVPLHTSAEDLLQALAIAAPLWPVTDP
jgi:hypothetical protein